VTSFIRRNFFTCEAPSAMTQPVPNPQTVQAGPGVRPFQTRPCARVPLLFPFRNSSWVLPNSLSRPVLVPFRNSSWVIRNSSMATLPCCLVSWFFLSSFVPWCLCGNPLFVDRYPSSSLGAARIGGPKISISSGSFLFLSSLFSLRRASATIWHSRENHERREKNVLAKRTQLTPTMEN